MTWLPVADGSVAERDAVLGLKPEIYATVREMLEISSQIADPRLLELCRLRLAQVMDCRAELAGADAELLAELEDWYPSAVFSERERAALSYAEQYHYDHHVISGEQKEELRRHLSEREVIGFVWALHMNDAYMRVLCLLDIEPDPPGTPTRPERTSLSDTLRPWVGSGPVEGETTDRDLLRDPDFFDGYTRLSRVVVRNSLVDEVTSESVRLRNANHQGCLY